MTMPVLKNPKGNIFYVYQLTDARNGEVFYVGKGQGSRKNEHVREAKRGYGYNVAKIKRIREIIGAGSTVIVDVVEDGLSEARALQLERRTIEGYSREQLTNLNGGVSLQIERDSLEYGRHLRRLRTEREWIIQFTRLRNRFPNSDDMQMYYLVRDGLFSEFCKIVTDLHKDGIQIPRVAFETLALMRKRHGKGIEQEARQG